jgi:hypothetical protein
VQQLPEDIKALIEILQHHGVEFAVSGGHAVAFHFPVINARQPRLVAPTPPCNV